MRITIGRRDAMDHSLLIKQANIIIIIIIISSSSSRSSSSIEQQTLRILGGGSGGGGKVMPSPSCLPSFLPHR